MADPVLSDSAGDDLIRRRFDDRLSEAEFEAFDEHLRVDAAFRERYVRHADLNACLYDEFSEVVSATEKSSLTRSRATGRMAVWACSLAAAAAMIAICIWSVMTSRTGDNIASSPAPDLQLPESDTIGVEHNSVYFLADETPGVPDAAVLILMDGEQKDHLSAGFRFRPGLLRLNEAYLQMEFFSGAVIGLTGPAELRIESKDAATIFSGQVTAYVPDRARGFVLNAPGAAVVDLGTEFGLRIDESGNTEVEVIQGEVELSLLGDDGTTLVSERVNDSRAVRVDRDLHRLTELDRNSELDQPSDRFPQLRLMTDHPLSVNEAYVNAVKGAGPLIYWRFEGNEQPRVPNEVSDEWSATVHVADESSDGIRIANGHARFLRTETPRFLAIDSGIPGLNEHSYSIEFWMQPDDLSHATCVGIFPLGEPRARTHLNVIEIATETFLIHEPGAIRFLHRNPPEQEWKLGTNVFSKGICAPRQWQHVVAVKNPESMELYYNGQLARRVPITNANSTGEFRILVGQLNLNSTWRQYSGAIDELAVYPSALPAAEIARHYALMAEPK